MCGIVCRLCTDERHQHRWCSCRLLGTVGTVTGPIINAIKSMNLKSVMAIPFKLLEVSP